MATHLQHLEINCDAPPYAIVRACHAIGFRSPEDVRWCHLGRFLRQGMCWHHLLRFWHRLCGTVQPDRTTCSCGQELPRLIPVTFQWRQGDEAEYRLGQCRRCRTIFWDVA